MFKLNLFHRKPSISSHIMRIADRSGDRVLTWDVDNRAQVAEAQRQFAELVGAGSQAFAFPVAGAPGEVAETFDPQVEKYVIMPQPAGG